MELEEFWKIKNGEYIRTKEGLIGTFEAYADNYYINNCNATLREQFVDKKEITKHSKNIIDLIEVGDIIEHKIENEICKDEVWKIENGKIICTDGYENAVTSEDIISIVTKEQFNNIKYEVE